MKTLNLKYFGGSRFWSLEVTWRHRNVIIELVKSTFLLMLENDNESILHRYGNTGLQKFWSHEFDLLGSRDVIDHVTIGLGVGTFLLVVNDDHAPILHGYGDTGLQRFWGHEFDLLGSRDVIGHVTVGLGSCGFLLVVHWNHASILRLSLPRYKASKLHLPMLKAKNSLRMLRVTWPVGRGSKITAYLEFPRPYCLFTI